MLSSFRALPWRWQLRLLNAMAVTYFGVLTFGSLAIGLLVTLPEVYKEKPEILHNRRICACYIFGILLLNYICLKYYSRHSRVMAENCTLPRTSLGEESRICRTCVVTMPARAKHCPLCDICVLKRDHHCFFGGCCIGFHNQRYFIVFCLYGSFGAVYNIFATFSYLGIHYGHVLSSQFYIFLLPWLLYYWYMGQVAVNVVAMVIFSYFSIVTFLACSFFFGFQMVLLWRGQTSYEYMKGVQRYCYSLNENFRSVFGPLWFLNFVLPIPFFKSSGNGYNWRVLHECKQM